jgi:serine/threonine-protein kinase
MALGPGSRLGPYEILSLIGSGGMGEVYRAHDTKLGRDVALKVLPDTFTHDPERLARFRREAQVLAALNHPHIAQIHGLEEANGTQFLALELVDGESLDKRIARGPIPIDGALAIAKQIAEALEAAHDKGIVHRDLKPANIALTTDGNVKVLDFGLAKAAESTNASLDVTASPTITSPAMMTGVGVILGTAAYMAPEQAKGRPADKRSDIWAFGCVLYEMLTGKRAFDGEDVSDMLAAVLRGDPSWAALPADIPASIRRLIARCLEKDRRHRIADISAAEFVLTEYASFEPKASTTPIRPQLLRRRLIIGGEVLAASVVAAIVTWAVTRPALAPARPIRLSMILPPGQSVSGERLFRNLDISPDGTHVVYVGGSAGKTRLMVRAIDRLDGEPLPATDNTLGPFVSPDNEWVGFFTRQELRKVPFAGGTPVVLSRITGLPRGASWSGDGTIVFATSDRTTGLLSVSPGGGESKVLTRPDPAKGEVDHVLPFALPGARGVLFTIATTDTSTNGQVAVLDLKTGQYKILIRGASQAEYVETGHLVYTAAGALHAVRFDLGRLEVVGAPMPIAEEVSIVDELASYAVSQHGTLVYLSASLGGGLYNVPRSLVWVNRQGHEDPIALPPRTYTYPRIAPDGTRVAVDIRDQQNDIWVWDLARPTLSRVTAKPTLDLYPVWTPDSRRIIFYSTRGSGGYLYSQAADGTGTAEQLTTSTTIPHYPYSISPDGRRLIFQETLPQTGVGLSVLVMDGKPRIEPVLHSGFTETNGEISPDGRWLAYQSSESGQEEIYVRPFPNVEGGRWQISTDGGTRPLWARSGKELFYLDSNGLLTAVVVHTTPTFTARTPMRVLNTRYFTGFGGLVVAGRTYDVSPDGQRFLMIKDAAFSEQTPPSSITVVLNWTEELKRLLPTK